MPAFRNVYTQRLSGWAGEHIPVKYDGDACAPRVGEYSSQKTSISFQNHTSSGIITSPTPYLEGGPRLSGTPEQTPPNSPLDTPSPSPIQVPPPRISHTRRRDPSHIPRPRNAFILFRSAYITQRNELDAVSGSGEGQQNELSKHAAKVWNRMSEEEKRPYQDMAAQEKKEHTEKYPNYVYSPGRIGGLSSRRKVNTSAAGRKLNVGQGQKRRNSTAPVADSEDAMSAMPIVRTVLPTRERVPRAAAQRAAQHFVQSPSPSYDSSGASASPEVQPTHSVPMVGIPTLELTSVENTQDKQPELEINYMADYNQPMLESLHEHHGFKPYLTNDPIYSTMPPLPRSTSASPLPTTSSAYNFDFTNYAGSFSSNIDFSTVAYPSSPAEISYTYEPADDASGSLSNALSYPEALSSATTHGVSLVSTSDSQIAIAASSAPNNGAFSMMSFEEGDFTSDPELMGIMQSQAAMFDWDGFLDFSAF